MGSTANVYQHVSSGKRQTRIKRGPSVIHTDTVFTWIGMLELLHCNIWCVVLWRRSEGTVQMKAMAPTCQVTKLHGAGTHYAERQNTKGWMPVLGAIRDD